MVPASMPASTVILRPSGSEDETVEMQDRGLVGRAIVVSFLSCRFQHGSRKAIRIGVALNMSQPGVSRALNSVASLKSKGEGCRSRIATGIAGLRRLQSAAEIGRSAAHNLAK